MITYKDTKHFAMVDRYNQTNDPTELKAEIENEKRTIDRMNNTLQMFGYFADNKKDADFITYVKRIRDKAYMWIQKTEQMIK